MRVLILDCDFDRNVKTNGARLIKGILEPCGADTRIYRAFGPSMPSKDSLMDYDRVIITGSMASAYEKRNWVLRLAGTIRAIDRIGTRTLGICFGHQAIAFALGGTVEKGCGEQGFEMVGIAKEGRADILFGGLPKEFIAYQSHGDYVKSLPKSGVLLAKSRSCIQAYRIRKMYGVQFHPEISKEVAAIMYGRDDKPITFGALPGSYALPARIIENFVG